MNKTFKEQTTELVVAPPFKGKGLVNDRLRFDVSGLAPETNYTLTFNKDEGVKWESTSATSLVANYPNDFYRAETNTQIGAITNWAYDPTRNKVVFISDNNTAVFANDPLDGGSFDGYPLTNLTVEDLPIAITAITGTNVDNATNFGITFIGTVDGVPALLSLSETTVTNAIALDSLVSAVEGATDLEPVTPAMTGVVSGIAMDGQIMLHIVTYTAEDETYSGILVMQDNSVSGLVPLEVISDTIINPRYYSIFRIDNKFVITYNVSNMAKYWVFDGEALSSPVDLSSYDTNEDIYYPYIGYIEYNDVKTLYFANSNNPLVLKVTNYASEIPTITPITTTFVTGSGLFSDINEQTLVGMGDNGELLVLDPVTLAITNSVKVPDPLNGFSAQYLFPKYEDRVLVTSDQNDVFVLELPSGDIVDYESIAVTNIRQLATALTPYIDTIYNADGTIQEDSRDIILLNGAGINFQTPDGSDRFGIYTNSSEILDVYKTAQTESSGNINSAVNFSVGVNELALNLTSSGEGYVETPAMEGDPYIVGWYSNLELSPNTFHLNAVQTYNSNDGNNDLGLTWSSNLTDISLAHNKLVDTGNNENTIATFVMTNNGAMDGSFELSTYLSETLYTSSNNLIAQSSLHLGGNYASFTASNFASEEEVGIWLDPNGIDSGFPAIGVSGNTKFNDLVATSSFIPTGFDDAVQVMEGSIAYDNNFIYIKTNAGWAKAALTLLDPTP